MAVRHIFFVLIFLSIHIFAFPQDHPEVSIEGRVVDAETGLSLPGTNVFINNSTQGSAANDQGYFRIEGIQSGVIELIASRIGYEMVSYNITIQPGINYTIDFELPEKPIEADEIKVYASDSKKRAKQIQRFSKLFLGISKNARYCEIQNPEVLHFVKDRTFFGQMEVEASEPIHVINRALGYELKAHLMLFDWNGPTGEYAVKLCFDELQPESAEESARWQKARKEAYMGSFRHFIRSLSLGEVYDEGFEIYRGTISSSAEPSLEFIMNPVEELVENCQPEAIKKLQAENELYVIYAPDRSKVSALMLDSEFVYIDTTGTVYPPRNTMRNGYWFSQRIADELPLNYLPK